MPGSWTRSPVVHMWEASNQYFSLTLMFLPFSFSSPSPLKSISLSSGENLKKKRFFYHSWSQTASHLLSSWHLWKSIAVCLLAYLLKVCLPNLNVRCMRAESPDTITTDTRQDLLHSSRSTNISWIAECMKLSKNVLRNYTINRKLHHRGEIQKQNSHFWRNSIHVLICEFIKFINA